EAVDLRQPAVHEQEDHALGARGMIELARVEPAVLPERAGGPGDRLADEAGKREHAEAVADAAERVAARDRLPGFMRRHVMVIPRTGTRSSSGESSCSGRAWSAAGASSRRLSSPRRG